MSEFTPETRQKTAGAKADNVHPRKSAAVLQDNRKSVQQAKAAEAPTPNNTGLPSQLKAGIESLSGMSMDHVNVHYNSDKPAQLNAHAYAQGSDIHLASGQEKHLPHEAWHVVQQAQGRVRPTMQMKGAMINDHGGLEKEADLMGGRARSGAGSLAVQRRVLKNSAPETIQRIGDGLATLKDLAPEKTGGAHRWVKLEGELDGDVNTKTTVMGRGARASGNEKKWTTEVEWAAVHKPSEEGERMTAKKLGPDHLLGSGVSNSKSKKRRAFFQGVSGKEYVSGHLLNNNLGGSGKDARNLTAIPLDANSQHSKHVEELIKKRVNKNGEWLYYDMKVGYGAFKMSAQGALDKKLEESDFAEFLPGFSDEKAGGKQKANAGRKRSSPSAEFGEPGPKRGKKANAEKNTLKKTEDEDEGQIAIQEANNKLRDISYAKSLTAIWYGLGSDGNVGGTEYTRFISIPPPLTVSASASSAVPLKTHSEIRVSEGGSDKFVDAQDVAKVKTHIGVDDIVLTNQKALKGQYDEHMRVDNVGKGIENVTEENVEDVEQIVAGLEFSIELNKAKLLKFETLMKDYLKKKESVPVVDNSDAASNGGEPMETNE